MAVAIAARPQGGKSSLSVNLALQGASLMTDDALAVEVRHDGSILAHPGVGAATVRWPEAERLRERGLLDRLQVVGESSGGVRVLLNRADAPAPLAAVYWPERDPSLSRPEFIRLEPDPRPLLAATINLVVRDPERLRRHFEVSTAIAAAVPLFRIGIPRGMDAATLAEAIAEHARSGRELDTRPGSSRSSQQGPWHHLVRCRVTAQRSCSRSIWRRSLMVDGACTS